MCSDLVFHTPPRTYLPVHKRLTKAVTVRGDATPSSVKRDASYSVKPLYHDFVVDVAKLTPYFVAVVVSLGV